MTEGVAADAVRTDDNGSHNQRKSRIQRYAKRAFDVIVSLVAIVLLSPILMVISFAIMRDSAGPVLFRQFREGYRRSGFTILKFRTMTDSGTARFQQARLHDPRVTPVGAYLRSASSDELPQLFNVLFGTLSLVGPRPHVPELSARFAPHIEAYYERLDAKPGLTGLAQVSGLRGETETLEQMSARVRFDRAYVLGWSFWGDLMICFRTLKIPLGHDRAY